MAEIPRTQVVAYAVAAVLLVVAGAYLVGGGREDAGTGAARLALDGPGAGGAVAAGDGGTPGGGRSLYVHVAGAVRHPGLYRVPPGARVAVAVRRAGGATRRADPLGLNLAAPLVDGQQVVVPARGATVPGVAPAGPAGAGTAAGSAGGGQQRIQLSTATAEQLDGLDGIGPTLAKRILEYRQKHGGFRSIDELREVDGIGEKRFAALRGALVP